MSRLSRVPPGGSVAFHPTHINNQADQTAVPQHIPLATSGDGVQKLSDDIQVVEFLLEDEHFAFDLFEVWEVVEYTRITHPPDTPRISGVLLI